MKASSTTASSVPKSKKSIFIGNFKVQVSSPCLFFILIKTQSVEVVIRVYESKILIAAYLDPDTKELLVDLSCHVEF